MTEGAWSGNKLACAAGDIGAVGRTNTLKLVNLYRQMVGLPAVQMTDQWNAALQQCALMMDANNALSHTPPPSWACYGADGAAIAMQSNLATAAGVLAVDLYKIGRAHV